MTGHYENATKLLRSCQLSTERHPDDAEEYPPIEDGANSIGNALAAAQVHATLALCRAVEQLTEFIAYGQRARTEGNQP